MLGFDQFIHEPSSGRETNAELLPARRDTQSGKQVCFARTAFTNKQHGLGTFDVTTLGQVAHLGRADMRRLRIIKLFQGLYTWQMSFANAPLNGVPFTLFDLGGKQCFEISDMTLLLADGLFGETAELGSHHRHAQYLTVSFD